MRFLWDDKYFRICVYVAVTAILIFTGGVLIYNIKDVMFTLGNFVGVLLDAFAPLIVALVAVLFLNNVVKFYDKRLGSTVKNGFKKRTRATAAAYVSFAAVIAVLVFIAFNKLNATSIESLVEAINESIEGFADLFVLIKVKLAEFGVLENVDGYLEEFVYYLSEMLKSSVSNIAGTVSKTGSWIINIFIGLTIAFYLLSDRDRIVYYSARACDVFLPQKAANAVKTFFRDIVNIFSGYISGQVTDAVIIAVLISVCFSIIGIPYAPIVGIISGFSNLIPYVGAIMAFILSVILGLVSGAPIKALYAAITVLILQQVDSIVIVPRVVGKSVELHPALVLIGLAVFGKLFGIVGMVFAVPVTALIKHYLIKLYNHFDEKNLCKRIDK